MTTRFLVAVYAVAGIVAGYLVYRRAARPDLGTVASVVAALVLWPLWAPFALEQRPTPRRGPLASRIAAALSGGAGADTLLMDVGEAHRLLIESERAEARLGEIEARLATARGALAPAGAPGTNDGGARAELRAATIVQLEQLREREHRTLLELAEVCELLRAQTALAELGMSDRAEELRDELWARVQALSELSSGQGFAGRAPVQRAIAPTRT